MRVLGLTLGLAVLASGAGAETLRIASWNIEHFVADDGKGCAPRDAAGFQRVRDVLEAVDADVWLLQEIEGEAALAKVFDSDEWVFHVSGRPASDNFPECRGNKDQDLAMQATAIVVRHGVQHERLEDVRELDVAREGRMRWGTPIRLTGGAAPVDVMNVHLKSGCWTGHGQFACTTLFAQMPKLRQWIEARVAEDIPAIVGGDFNRRLEESDDFFWRLLNADSNLYVAGAGIMPNCFERFTEFIDFLVLEDTAMALKVPGSFVETTFSGPQDSFPSDHCPIHFELRLP